MDRKCIPLLSPLKCLIILQTNQAASFISRLRGRTLDISKHIYYVSTLYLTSMISRLRGRTLESLAEDTLQCGHQGEAARSQGDTCSHLQQEVLYPQCTTVNISAVNITAAVGK